MPSSIYNAPVYTSTTSNSGAQNFAGQQFVAQQPIQQTSMSISTPVQSYMVSEAALYHPVGCEYIAPGRNLRSGMTPLYSTTAVRTYEASPVFSTDKAPIYQMQRNASTSSSSSTSSVREQPLKQNKKNYLCC